MTSISIHGADQVLLPPRDGLPYVRLDRISSVSLGPGALSADHGRIVALGADPGAAIQVDAGGGAIVPGFVDARTHLPFGGWDGTVRAADEAAILRQSRGVAAEMLREGTTAFECRGASVAALRLAARLGGTTPQLTVSTAAVDDAELPRVVAETRAHALAVAEADLAARGPLAAAHDLWLRVDTERDVHGALALGARAVEGLGGIEPADLAPLAEAECAAVLTPTAELLGAEHLAPGRDLLDAGAIGVLATGLHALDTPSSSMPLAIGLAARLHGWTAVEALIACTLNAAWLLGVGALTGSLEPGKRADVLILDGPVGQLTHRLGRNPVAAVVCDGELAWVRPDQAWRVTRH